MRKAFVQTLTEIVERNKDVLLLTGDLGFSVFEDFKSRYPDNYLNAGVAESGLIGIASGLAMGGKKVFAYSIAPFLVYRAFEQIRDDICMHRLPVVIVGVGSGFAYGNAGPTHHAVEDLALMSVLPNMTVIAPGDPMEVKWVTNAVMHLNGPAYVRLNRAGDKVIHNEEVKFEIGKGILMGSGQDVLLVSTGNMLEEAMKVRVALEQDGISSELISMHTVKPFDKKMLIERAEGKTIVATLEEHLPFGGLGQIVAASLMENQVRTDFMPFALPDKFTDISASQMYLRRAYGLDSQSISTQIKQKFKEIRSNYN